MIAPVLRVARLELQGVEKMPFRFGPLTSVGVKSANQENRRFLEQFAVDPEAKLIVGTEERHHLLFRARIDVEVQIGADPVAAHEVLKVVVISDRYALPPAWRPNSGEGQGGVDLRG